MPDLAIDLAWGPAGSREAAARGCRVVVVDVLSFSSTVVAAAERGITVFPVGPDTDVEAVAARVDAETAVRRGDWPGKGRFCLSPESFRRHAGPARVVLRSPNGGGCVEAAAGAREVLVGSLRNAGAVARYLEASAPDGGREVVIVPCGEWTEAGDIRFALEDWLGAGAIASALEGARSAEAEAAARGFVPCAADLDALLLGCRSGEELSGRGFADDVTWAAAWNASVVVPRVASDGGVEAVQT